LPWWTTSFRTNSGVEVWGEYCRRLHESDVQAFGITDYYSADSYLATVGEYRKRYADSSKIFFPNIELRTNDVVNSKHEEVNIHLLFNPFQPNYAAKISSFLCSLKTNKTDGAGRNVRANELNREHDYASATTTRAFIREALEGTYGKDADLLDCVLIITPANNDGIRPERGKKRKLLITDELDKFSDAFFGNARNVSYFLNTNRAEDKQGYTKPKPVLSGCDAHSFDDLDAKLGQVVTSSTDGIILEPTWIKGDLTYEGLKQIIFEPANRVYIGAEPEVERRVRQNGPRYINSLHIDCVSGYQTDEYGTWFCNEKILLGKELVAIIGNKGSGKSAVADVIGLLGNSHNQISKGPSSVKSEELFSFLNKEKFLKGGCAKKFEATLNWYAGEPDKRVLNVQTETHLPEKVKYLPQKYLERICTNIADDEFRATLNEVIFRYVKPKDRHGQSNLEDLIKYRTRQAEEDIEGKKQNLRQVNASIIAFEKKLTEDYQEKLEEKIRLKKEEIEAHSNTRPEEKPNPDEGKDALSDETAQVKNLQQKIEMLTEQITQYEDEQVKTSVTVEQLKQVHQAIAREVANLTKLKTEHGATLETAGLRFEQIVNLTIDFGPLDTVVAHKEKRLEEIGAILSADGFTAMENGEVALLEDSSAEPIAKSITYQKTSLEVQRDEIVDRLSKPAHVYQQYLRDLKAWTDREKELQGDEQNPGTESLKGLECELENVKFVYPETLRTFRTQRNEIAKDLFTRKCGLTHFYNVIKQSIDEEITKCLENLEKYNISIEAGLQFNLSFTDEFLRFINQSAIGSFRGQEEGRTMLRTITDEVEDWDDETQVLTALDALVEALHTDKREEVSTLDTHRNIFKQIKSQKTVQELYDYLFGLDYLITKYDIKIDGKDLSELSPGERGGLLLIFYLMLDRQEIPLVIDQPEDNLDNESVYEVLVTFIKQARKRRQIILVTHNPNLAVAADAEQIIHVSIDKEGGQNDFDFFSGAIEAPDLNKAVVKILEGTLPAFDNRRLKYRRFDRSII
jgi:ABC-type lipoprotein export system ATPase subunit